MSISLSIPLAAAATTTITITISTISPITLSFHGTDNHLRRPELKYFGHGKIRNPVDAQIKGFDVGNIPIGRLGDEMRSQRPRQSRHTDLKVVLKDLIGRPSVLSRFAVMNVLSVAQNLALSAIEGPRKDDFVFAATAIGSILSGGYGGGIGDTKLEGDLLFGKAKGLGGVFDTVVDRVGAEDVRHLMTMIVL